MRQVCAGNRWLMYTPSACIVTFTLSDNYLCILHFVFALVTHLHPPDTSTAQTPRARVEQAMNVKQQIFGVRLCPVPERWSESWLGDNCFRPLVPTRSASRYKAIPSGIYQKPPTTLLLPTPRTRASLKATQSTPTAPKFNGFFHHLCLLRHHLRRQCRTYACRGPWRHRDRHLRPFGRGEAK